MFWHAGLFPSLVTRRFQKPVSGTAGSEQREAWPLKGMLNTCKVFSVDFWNNAVEGLVNVFCGRDRDTQVCPVYKCAVVP